MRQPTKKCYDCNHCEMCAWLKEVEEQGCEFFDDGNRWIPCSERLPNYRELVLVTTRDLRVNIAYLDAVQEDGTDDIWTMPLDDADCALWNVIAWMPFPKPWKGEKDDD